MGSDRREMIILLYVMLVNFVSADECCLCGYPHHLDVADDTVLFIAQRGFGTCAQLEWHLLENAKEGDEDCSRHQKQFGDICCTSSNSRMLQWDGFYVAQPWEEKQTEGPLRTNPSSYQSWNTQQHEQPPGQQVVHTPQQVVLTPQQVVYAHQDATKAIAPPNPQHNPVQYFQSAQLSANLPPIVNSWGSANRLSEFDRCMLYEKDASVSSTYCSICARPTNFARGVVINDRIAGGNIDFVSSCGDLNAAFKCARVTTDHQICNLFVYGYANQCGCREFDNNSEELFGFKKSNDSIGQWVAWTPGNRPLGG